MLRASIAASKVLPPTAVASGVVLAKEDPGLVSWLIDPRLAIVVGIGVPLGIMFRTAYLYGERKRAEDIKRDLVVSLLIAGANFAFSAWIATRAGLSYLEALMVSGAIAATGVKAIMSGIYWGWRKLAPVEERMGEKRQDDQRLMSAVRRVLDEEKQG